MASVAERDPWNQVRIPSPGSLSTVAVEDEDGAIGACIKAVIKECHTVKMSLIRKGLDAETGVLRAILYSNHNKLCHHKPYLALKQVEQCLKRLNCVDLEGSIQDFFELCPTEDKLERRKKYIIPSQPVMEFVLMKILGTCKLILRLLDCCCKTFRSSFSVKHLCLEEFIILNTVITGLVSRLWVLYKDVLKKLISLYQPLFKLLQEVSRIQPKPYFKNFTFPTEITEFLGEAYLDITNKKMVAKGVTKLLNKLFLAKENSTKPIEETEAPQNAKQMRIKITDKVDIGKAVLKRKTYGETSSVFDLKAFCKKTRHKATVDAKLRSVCSEMKVRKVIGSSQWLVGPTDARKLVLRIREARSFTQLSEELQKAIFWCRSKKLKQKVTFLGNKLLKSNRLKHVEAQGCNLSKKLNCIKTSICNSLLRGMGNMSSKCHLRRITSQNKLIKKQRKPQRKLQPTVLKEIQQFPHHTEKKAVTERDAKRTFSDLILHRPEVTSKKSQLPDDRNANLIENCNSVLQSPTLAQVRENNTMSKAVEDMDDIDDIFSSLGV